jgi:nucleoprotein TPR
MGLSPTVVMVSWAQRSGKTFTEVYAEHVRLQDKYVRKSAEYDHMDRTLQAVLAQIKERAPVLSQQRLKYERLQVEAGQLAPQLASALTDRDTNASLAQETSQKLKKTTRENELLESQLNDLGLRSRR